MNHSLDIEKYRVAELGDVRLYISSYELSRDRRYSFQNRSENSIYFTDNGSFPAYLKLKGIVLKSECPIPGVKLNQQMSNNIRYFLTADGIFYNAARLKTFSVVTDVNSELIKCEIVLCCDSYIEQAEVKDKDHSGVRHEHSGSAAFIFSNFIWIKPYEICAAGKEFFRGCV